jgi:aldehyde oxidoreductase
MKLEFTLNGNSASWDGPPVTRLAAALRDDLGLTGTKIGCDAGDCGACTVLLDGRQVCSCLVAMGQVAGRSVETVEGLESRPDAMAALQQSFLDHGAAQCGICTPGMLMAAQELVRKNDRPSRAEVEDALGGVLCRCTGYGKIVDAVMDVVASAPGSAPPAGEAVGSRIVRVDGPAKVTGRDVFGADGIPAEALWIRVVRSPHARARFELGDLEPLRRRLAAVLTAADVPFNGYGIYPDIKDQPVLADGQVRYRGEAVVALVGERDQVLAIRDDEVPIAWIPEPPVFGVDAARAEEAPLVQADRPGNLLLKGGVKRGDAANALDTCAAVAEGTFETAFVEHAYIEPEAGWALRVGDRIEIHATTQTPYMDRDEIANLMRLKPEAVRIVPTACGGGFGGKLDLSVQPLLAIAAWTLGRPVAMVYTRPESMAASTKRHPARVTARFGCDADGQLLACDVTALFDTGAYASWGPTVANRVPVHAMGPYAIPNVRTWGEAFFTNGPPAGGASASPHAGMAAAIRRLPNPSTIRIGLSPKGEVVLHQGATRHRPGLQHRHCADRAEALGLPLSDFRLIGPTPGSPRMRARPRPAVRPMSRAGRPRPLPKSCAPRSCVWPMPGMAQPAASNPAAVIVSEGERNPDRPWP